MGKLKISPVGLKEVPLIRTTKTETYFSGVIILSRPVKKQPFS